MSMARPFPKLMVDFTLWFPANRLKPLNHLVDAFIHHFVFLYMFLLGSREREGILLTLGIEPGTFQLGV